MVGLEKGGKMVATRVVFWLVTSLVTVVCAILSSLFAYSIDANAFWIGLYTVWGAILGFIAGIVISFIVLVLVKIVSKL
jgi:hypothetical protein